MFYFFSLEAATSIYQPTQIYQPSHKSTCFPFFLTHILQNQQNQTNHFIKSKQNPQTYQGINQPYQGMN